MAQRKLLTESARRLVGSNPRSIESDCVVLKDGWDRNLVGVAGLLKPELAVEGAGKQVNLI